MKDQESIPEDPKQTKKPGPIRIIRNRIVTGLFVALPILITFFILKWVYDILYGSVIKPIANLIVEVWNPEDANLPDGSQLPGWFANVMGPLLAVAVVFAILFLCGMFFRSRLHRFFDWIMTNVPGVGTIYSSVKNVVDAIQRSQTETTRFQRTVLVHFPHSGMKVPAFVTSSCVDEASGKTILCVYVPTTPIPTSGYMLLVPESEVVDLEWGLQDTLQAIVSGGITVPKTVNYGPFPRHCHFEAQHDQS